LTPYLFCARCKTKEIRRQDTLKMSDALGQFFARASGQRKQIS